MTKSTYRTPYTVQQLPWQSGGQDAHGNPIEGHGDPVDVDVYGWSVPQSDEHRPDGVTIDVRLYGPPTMTVTSRDLFRLPTIDGDLEVVGEVEDYNHGPFGWRPGVVVNLRRVEG